MVCPRPGRERMRGSMRAGLIAALAGVCAGLVPSIGAAAPCTPVLSPSAEAALTGLINAERRAERIPKVVKKAALRKQGREKSMAMARGAAFAHSGGALRWAHGRAGAQNIAMAPSAREAFQAMLNLSLIHISEPTRRTPISYAVFCLK